MGGTVRVYIAWLVAIFLASCSSVTERQLSKLEVDAVQQAETFVLRHGYTQRGHPPNMTVKNVEILDGMLSDQELINNRNNSLQESAFGIIDLGDGSFYVLFHLIESEVEIQPVFVKDGVAVQVVHANIRKEGLSYVKVPRF